VRIDATSRAATRRLGAVLLVAALAWGGCTKEPSEAERCDSDFGCAKELTCSQGKCVPCDASEMCRSQGMCADVAGQCRAVTDEACRSADACGQLGWCASKDGACVAGADADCAPTSLCKELGKCAAQEGNCEAMRDEDCKPTDLCKKQGWCVARAGRCVAP
jgi:hypothetical protein